MKGRHALALGFGLGGFVVIALIAAAGLNFLGPQHRTAVDAAVSPSASAQPTATASPSAGVSPSPSPSPDTSGPGPRNGSAMVYDPEDHGVLLFGGATVTPTADGHNPSVTLGDTWLWSDHSWRLLSGDGPPARSDATVGYDSVRHVVVLFGGSGPGGIGQGQYFQDTWTWDGQQWHQESPAHSPNPRARAAMAFDERHGVTVMFGGEGETTTYDATWTWDGTDWTLLSPSASPSARHFMSMAYDAGRGVTVLFGGTLPGKRFNDTWVWDGTTWTRQSTPAPKASGFTRLAYDAAAKEVVAYVYYALDNHPAAEYTMTWDGSGWIDRTNTSDPGPRAETAMAYDDASGEIVLFGGTYIDPVPYSDTWTWSGSFWSLRA
jgi:hypothetical protein